MGYVKKTQLKKLQETLEIRAGENINISSEVKQEGLNKIIEETLTKADERRRSNGRKTILLSDL